MKKYLVYLSAIAAVSYCGPKIDYADVRSRAKSTFGTIPAKMPGGEKDTAELVALGKMLYHERRLSINDTQSCASCHILDGKKGGVDNTKFSPGAKGALGGRNAPTTLNAGFHFAQFWDGRAATLSDQAKGPILNPVEMGMPNEKAVIEKLSKITEYKEAFAKAFPGAKNPITYQNLADAIAAFERTLVTHDRFDDFINGNDKALSSQEIAGLQSFMSQGCTTCHIGPLLGGNSYRKMGQAKPYESKDQGRFDLTKKEEDRMMFKVPSLRNVALTDPYFHDGSAATLTDAVAKMAYHQLGKQLGEKDVANIVAFLKALTDKERQ
ncbi:MAG: cytochrome-c peroxidase [Leptospiraceae bacterium]|nr:cytochrome-c peroxidase [Leptospiraceae bacterium]